MQNIYQVSKDRTFLWFTETVFCAGHIHVHVHVYACTHTKCTYASATTAHLMRLVAWKLNMSTNVSHCMAIPRLRRSCSQTCTYMYTYVHAHNCAKKTKNVFCIQDLWNRAHPLFSPPLQSYKANTHCIILCPRMCVCVSAHMQRSSRVGQSH